MKLPISRRQLSIRPGLTAWVVIVALVAGCGSIEFRMGEEFDSTHLKRDLQTGVSTAAQVEDLLGRPFGVGRALMPYHESPRTVWK